MNQTSITVPELQNIAVQCVSDYFNQGVPLNEGLAKVASDRSMNAEQVKRAVEAVNTLAHLKTVQVNPDRTCEFPVASFQGVMDSTGSFEKMASEWEQAQANSNPTPLQENSSLEKTASAEPVLSGQGYFESLSLNGKLLSLEKLASRAAQELESVKSRSLTIVPELLKAAGQIKANAQNPMLEVSASKMFPEGATFTKAASSIKTLSGVALEFKSYSSLVKTSSDMRVTDKIVENFFSLMKEAQDLQSRQNILQDQLEKAQGLRAELFKQAGLQLKMLPGVKGFPPSVLKAGKSAKVVSADPGIRPGMNGLVEKRSFITPLAGMLGRAVGKTTSIAMKPVAATGRALGKIPGSLAKATKEISINAAAKTDIGKQMGIQPIPPVQSSIVKKRLGTAAAVAGVGMDAAMYTPTVDPLKGRSGDVWSALQGGGS